MTDKHMIRLLRRAARLYGYASTMANCATEEIHTSLITDFSKLSAEYAEEASSIMARVNAAIGKEGGAS